MRKIIITTIILLSVQCILAQKTVWSFPSQNCKDAIDSLRKYNYVDYYGLDGWSSTSPNAFKPRYFFSAVMAYHSQWALDLIEETFVLIKQNPEDRPTDYYDNEGWFSHNYGESFDRAYELYPNVYNDDYFDALHKKYGRENDMGW
ncbi:MAG: hypothetical protein MJZ57_02235 [Bacteroidales bacterium]|nr:hypothetical protein [Bacteroidales bacterium]